MGGEGRSSGEFSGQGLGPQVRCVMLGLMWGFDCVELGAPGDVLVVCAARICNVYSMWASWMYACVCEFLSCVSGGIA